MTAGTTVWMKPRAARAVTLLIVLGTAGASHAHGVGEGLGGFSGGFLHPLLEPAHLMAVVTLALLIGQRGFAATQPAMWTFAAGLAAGLFAAAAGWTQGSPIGALVAAAATGALVAIGKPWPRLVYGLVALAAGAAIGLASMPEGSTPREATPALIGTFFGACIWVADGALLAARIRQPWGLILVRVVASWMTAGALLVLALRIARAAAAQP